MLFVDAAVKYNIISSTRVFFGIHFRQVLLSLSLVITLFFLRRIDLLIRLRAAEGFGYPPRFDTFHNIVCVGEKP